MKCSSFAGIGTGVGKRTKMGTDTGGAPSCFPPRCGTWIAGASTATVGGIRALGADGPRQRFAMIDIDLHGFSDIEPQNTED